MPMSPKENTEMEVMVAIPSPMDFNFLSNCSSPYITAPSSPQHFFNEQLSNNNDDDDDNNDGNDNFEFNFSGHLQRPSLSADELFHGGKIRPLNPTANNNNNASSTKKNTAQVATEDNKDFEILVVGQHLISAKSRWNQTKNHLWCLVTGSRNKSNGYSSIQHYPVTETNKGTRNQKQKRGRQRNSSSSSSSYNDNIKGKCVSSLISQTAISNATSTYCASFLSSIWFTKGYRKWRLKDFLLFCSASEGRSTDNDQLGKYSILSKTTACEDVGNGSFRSETTAYGDVGNCSFRSTDESAGSVSRRRVSAHELHYTVNRAASEELKKKTLLPYKHGLLGCLRFNNGSGMQYISTRMGSLERS